MLEATRLAEAGELEAAIDMFNKVQYYILYSYMLEAMRLADAGELEAAIAMFNKVQCYILYS
jgi:hypothetical protein